MSQITFFEKTPLPLEMHKVRVVQKLELPPVEARLAAIQEAGNNTFLLKNRSIFLDMLTDSGVNAMSDRQVAAMMQADDSYAGSMSFERLETACRNIFNMPFALPVHQGRAAENILAEALVKPGNIVPMNYHFTTTRAHIVRRGGRVVELLKKDGYVLASDDPFKGEMDVPALQAFLNKEQNNVPFVRMEAGTNLIGGQPWSLANLTGVSAACRKAGVPLVLDASLLADNLYFIAVREAACQNLSIREITRRIADLCDIIYFSARKFGCARGGMILVNDKNCFERMREFVPLFEGFLTYGGMSVREMEAIAVGLEESMDFDMVRHGPEFIQFMVDELRSRSIPVVTPGGGLGCHLNAMDFLPHVPQEQFPAGSLAAALFIASGARGMERGTLSEERNPDGSEHPADMELVRLALPRRVYTVSQIKYVVDRLHWLFENRTLIQGLTWQEEPKILRFFTGRLRAVSDWQEKLAAKFRADFGDSL